nr:Uncharacterised protein [Raoultella sp. NCTC 9187]
MKMRIACLLLALLALNVISLLMGAVPLPWRALFEAGTAPASTTTR